MSPLAGPGISLILPGVYDGRGTEELGIEGFAWGEGNGDVTRFPLDRDHWQLSAGRAGQNMSVEWEPARRPSTVHAGGNWG